MQESVDAGTFTQLYHHIRPFVWAMPIINGVATLVLAWFTWKLYQDFGMEVWHSIGAGRQMKRMFTQYQIFLCVLKFDVSSCRSSTSRLCSTSAASFLSWLTRSDSQRPYTSFSSSSSSVSLFSI